MYTVAMRRLFYCHKGWLGIAILFGMPLLCTGQQNIKHNIKVEFESTQLQLGKVMETEGVVKHRFSFTNRGEGPLQVDRVEASCGCTSPSWSKDPIAVGSRGFVDVQFDPHNRPGPFNKSLVVYYKQSEATSSLSLEGFVVPKPKSLEVEFPLVIGDLRLKNRFMNLGNITSKGLYAQSFETYNDSKDILVFSDHMEGPDHITITFEPYTLKPGARGLLWVHYDVAAKKDLGYFRENVAIFTYESNQPRKDLVVTATLIDVPPSSGVEQPKVYFPEAILDFGIKQQGDTVEVSYSLRNRGQATLVVKKAQPSCNCLRVSLASSNIQPGDSTTIKAVFFTHDRLGNQHKTISVFTNDPVQPVYVLTLKGLLRGPRD